MSIPVDTIAMVPISTSINFNIFPILKGLLIAFLGFYLVLLIMVLKQVDMMSKTVRSAGNKYIFMLAWIQIIGITITIIFAILAL